MSIRVRFLKSAGALALLALFSASAPAEAVTISIEPSVTNAQLNDTFDVDIVVSGLGAVDDPGGISVAQAGFWLLFDDSILQGTGYVADPEGKMGTAICGFCDFGPGFLPPDLNPATPQFDLSFLADLLTHEELRALQGDSFILATLSFTAIGTGLTDLVLSKDPQAVYLVDGNFNEVDAAVQGAQVCVDALGRSCDLQPVPEPGSLSLLGLGAVAFAGAWRRRNARRA
jgi:hypothetical protein